MDLPKDHRGLLLVLAASAASILLYVLGLAIGHLGLVGISTAPLLPAVILLTGFFGAREWSWLAGTFVAGVIGVLQIGLSYLGLWAAAPDLVASSDDSPFLVLVTIGFVIAYTLLGAVGATFARVLGRYPTPHRVGVVSATWVVGFGLLRWLWVTMHLGSFLVGPTPKEATILHDWPVYAWWLLPPLSVLVLARPPLSAPPPPTAG